MKKTGKSEAMAGIELTGHYCFGIGAYLENDGILLVMVNTYSVIPEGKQFVKA